MPRERRHLHDRVNYASRESSARLKGLRSPPRGRFWPRRGKLWPDGGGIVPEYLGERAAQVLQAFHVTVSVDSCLGSIDSRVGGGIDRCVTASRLYSRKCSFMCIHMKMINENAERIILKKNRLVFYIEAYLGDSFLSRIRNKLR